MFERAKAAYDAFFRAGPDEDLRKDVLVRSEKAEVPLDVWQELQEFSENPDALLDDLNAEESLYQEMMRDGVVKSSVNRKIISVISQDYVVLAQDTDDEKQKDVAAFVEWTLRNFQPNPNAHKLTISSFRTGLLQLCDAVPTGYSVTELLFGPIQDAAHRGKIGIVAMKGKDPVGLKLRYDPYLNLTGITNTVDGDTERLNPKNKFIVFPWMQKYANSYGTSDLQAAYRPYQLKKILFRVWAIALEKYAMPTVVGTYPETWKKAQIDSLENAIRKLQQDTAITIPEGGVITFLENAVGNNSKVFEDAINALDRQILLAIEGVSIHVIEGNLTGARAAGLVAADQANLFVWFLSRSVEEIINGQLIPKIIAANFTKDDGVTRPIFSFVDPGDEDLVVDSQIDTALTAMGVPLPLSYFYEHYGRPEPQKDEPVVQAPAAAAPTDAPPPMFQVSEPPENGNGRNRFNGGGLTDAR